MKVQVKVQVKVRQPRLLRVERYLGCCACCDMSTSLKPTGRDSRLFMGASHIQNEIPLSVLLAMLSLKRSYFSASLPISILSFF